MQAPYTATLARYTRHDSRTASREAKLEEITILPRPIDISCRKTHYDGPGVISCLCPLRTVGYTMRDIRYKWNEGPNSVGVSNEVSLPQFKVLGHRQRAMDISLSTGIRNQGMSMQLVYETWS